MREWLQRVWYRPPPPPAWLRVMARIYAMVADWRATRQRAHAQHLPVPVVVVGNITVGGTGKTPCVRWLVECLQEIGWRPGIVSRGYKGRGPFPHVVSIADDPVTCGDEPVLLAATTSVPVVVDPDRVSAGKLLLALHPQVNVLVCDDGLQHYRLARDLEFCVIDGSRGYGNGWLLPAGPLREHPARAGQSTLLWVNGADATNFGDKAIRFDLVVSEAVNLSTGESRPLSSFAGKMLHAIAGIGYPQRFFNALRDHGLSPQTHAFPDHHVFHPSDFPWASDEPVLMTEKDAIKCRHFAREGLWGVPASVQITASAVERVKEKLNALEKPCDERSRIPVPTSGITETR